MARNTRLGIIQAFGSIDGTCVPINRPSFVLQDFFFLFQFRFLLNIIKYLQTLIFNNLEYFVMHEVVHIQIPFLANCVSCQILHVYFIVLKSILTALTTVKYLYAHSTLTAKAMDFPYTKDIKKKICLLLLNPEFSSKVFAKIKYATMEKEMPHCK